MEPRSRLVRWKIDPFYVILGQNYPKDQVWAGLILILPSGSNCVGPTLPKVKGSKNYPIFGLYGRNYHRWSRLGRFNLCFCFNFKLRRWGRSRLTGWSGQKRDPSHGIYSRNYPKASCLGQSNLCFCFKLKLRRWGLLKVKGWSCQKIDSFFRNLRPKLS